MSDALPPEVTLHFKLIKGKRGDHVHATIDGRLMGMFKKDEGVLTGEGSLPVSIQGIIPESSG